MIEIQDKRRDFFISLGVLILIAGIVTIGFSVIASIILIVFSIGFFFGSKGVEIDLRQNKYRTFWSSWFVKFGKWKSVYPEDELNLSLSASNSHMKMGGFENVLIASSKTILYILSIERSSERLEVMRFKSYRRARKAMDSLSSNFELEYLDEIAKKLEENIWRRRGRR
jgi:hypothetical protein